MTDFKTKTMTKKTTTKKMLAGAATVVALSGFVPAINAASPTATANVGVSVVIQQAITINVGAPVNFGTIILSNTTVAGGVYLQATGAIVTTGNVAGELSLAGGHALGTMAINSSAGSVNIALGAAPTDDNGNLAYYALKFGGAITDPNLTISSNSNANVNLTGSSFNIGGALTITSKPTPGIYNTKSYLVTVTDI